jgi:hypothetical protein
MVICTMSFVKESEEKTDYYLFKQTSRGKTEFL